MQRDPHVLFSTIVRPAQCVLNEIGPERKVYTFEKILKAFKTSKIDFDICSYLVYKEQIPGAQEQIIKLTDELEKLLEEIYLEDGFSIEPEMGFDATDYLDATCLRVKDYIEESGPTALCYPWKDRIHIEGCFRHYHIYTFLEEHIDAIGREEFLGRTPDLECFINDCRINDTFYWDRFDTGPLYEAERDRSRQNELKLEESLGRR